MNQIKNNIKVEEYYIRVNDACFTLGNKNLYDYILSKGYADKSDIGGTFLGIYQIEVLLPDFKPDDYFKYTSQLDDKEIKDRFGVSEKYLQILRLEISSILSNEDLKAKTKSDQISEKLTRFLKQIVTFYSIKDDAVQEIWVYDTGIYVPNGISFIMEMLRKVMQEKFDTNICNKVVAKIQSDTFIDSKLFFSSNPDINIVPVENGLLNIKTNKLQNFSSEYIFFNKIPIYFDPTAKCPKIKQFFFDIVKDKRDVKVLQELFGYCLLRENKFERLFMFLGTGRNGKSKISDLIERFVGEYNCASLQPSTFENPDSFAIGDLYGKLVNMAMDINKTALKNTGVLKNLSGRDTITAQRKYKTAINFTNYSKLIFGANELPITYDLQEGFWERWILIDFPYTFVQKERLEDCASDDMYKYKERDVEIIDKITTEQEMSGLLNWALEGLSDLLDNKDFSYRYTPEEVKSIWIRKSDSFAAFMSDCLEFNDFEAKILKSDLRKAYTDYCKQHNIRPLSDKMILNRLSDEGVTDKRVRHNDDDFYVWLGVKYKDIFETKKDIHNFSYYKEPQVLDLIKDYFEKVPKVTKQDAYMNFGKEIIDKLLLEGDLIEVVKGELDLKQ